MSQRVSLREFSKAHLVHRVPSTARTIVRSVTSFRQNLRSLTNSCRGTTGNGTRDIVGSGCPRQTTPWTEDTPDIHTATLQHYMVSRERIVGLTFVMDVCYQSRLVAPEWF